MPSTRGRLGLPPVALKLRTTRAVALKLAHIAIVEAVTHRAHSDGRTRGLIAAPAEGASLGDG